MFYAVKRGRIPGIYNDWESCKAQIHQFHNAKFKKFNDHISALNYLNTEQEITNNQRPTEGIAVDASYLNKSSTGEYQIFNFSEQKIVYNSRIYNDVTVNIMEFLAIVKALQLYPNETIYSDSATAIVWIQNKNINTNATYGDDTKREIEEAIIFLKDIENYKVVKWDTKQLGEIPADFNRK